MVDPAFETIPLVSVCMITYNHEKFLAEAIEGVVMQKTDFPFELVIGEDCSTDSTRKICLEYKEKYPHIIRLQLPEKNLGMMLNLVTTQKACEGKYIALCEGDDYWTDPHKLQKQADFMESHPDYVMTAHAADVMKFDKMELCTIDERTLDLEYIIRNDWSLMTATIFFRKDAMAYPDWYYNIKNDDYGLQLLVALNGKINFDPTVMSVYRMHADGISMTLKPLNQAAWVIFLLRHFNEYTNYKYNKLIKEKVKRVYNNQIGFADEYRLRRQAWKLRFFRFLNPIFPSLITSQRK